jgi:hypothetical protein
MSAKTFWTAQNEYGLYLSTPYPPGSVPESGVAWGEKIRGDIVPFGVGRGLERGCIYNLSCTLEVVSLLCIPPGSRSCPNNTTYRGLFYTTILLDTTRHSSLPFPRSLRIYHRNHGQVFHEQDESVQLVHLSRRCFLYGALRLRCIRLQRSTRLEALGCLL